MDPINRISGIFVLCLLCASCKAQAKSNYFIGGWSSMSANDLETKFAPLFQKYLTEEVGSLYEPPIQFTFLPFFYDATNSAQVMIDSGKLDFAYHTSGVLACLQAEYGYATIASQVTETMGYDSRCLGSVLFTAKSNSAITNMNDFRGKRLGVGYPWAAGSFLLGSKLLDQNGLNIYTSFRQVTFYLDNYAQMLDDVLQNKIDVAIIHSGWIEAQAPQKLPLIVYHNVNNATCAAEPYPFPTSTKVVPAFGLLASPSIPAQLSQQVASALRKLNSSYPAAKAAGIARFTLPESYEDSRSLVEHLGMMITTPEGKQCLDIFAGLEHIVSCPSGYQLKDYDTIRRSCADVGLPCPSGMACYCDPCMPVAQNVFPWELVIGLCGGLYVMGLCLWVQYDVLAGEDFPEPRLGMSLSAARGVFALKGPQIDLDCS